MSSKKVTWAGLGLLATTLTLVLSACPAAPPKKKITPTTQKAPPAPARLTFTDSTPVDAQVMLNGVAIGTIAELMAQRGLVIKPGIHRIEVRRRGYHPFRVELVFGKKGEQLKVQLKKRPR